MIYTYLGGLKSAIYNEVLQFFLIVIGFLPLVIIGLQDVGGWDGLTMKLNEVAIQKGYAAGTWTSTWKYMGSAATNPMGVDWIAMITGLGFVLAFGYWCTNFLVVQRAMAANSQNVSAYTGYRSRNDRHGADGFA